MDKNTISHKKFLAKSINNSNTAVEIILRKNADSALKLTYLIAIVLPILYLSNQPDLCIVILLISTLGYFILQKVHKPFFIPIILGSLILFILILFLGELYQTANTNIISLYVFSFYLVTWLIMQIFLDILPNVVLMLKNKGAVKKSQWTLNSINLLRNNLGALSIGLTAALFFSYLQSYYNSVVPPYIGGSIFITIFEPVLRYAPPFLFSLSPSAIFTTFPIVTGISSLIFSLIFFLILYYYYRIITFILVATTGKYNFIKTLDSDIVFSFMISIVAAITSFNTLTPQIVNYIVSSIGLNYSYLPVIISIVIPITFTLSYDYTRTYKYDN